MPRSLSKYVTVRHPKFGEKQVRRDQLPSLSGRWKRVGLASASAPKKKTSATSAASTTQTGTTEPEPSKED